MISTLLLTYCVVMSKILYILLLGYCPLKKMNKLNLKDIQASFCCLPFVHLLIVLKCEPSDSFNSHITTFECFQSNDFYTDAQVTSERKPCEKAFSVVLACVKLSYSSVVVFHLFTNVFFIYLWSNGVLGKVGL